MASRSRPVDARRGERVLRLHPLTVSGRVGVLQPAVGVGDLGPEIVLDDVGLVRGRVVELPLGGGGGRGETGEGGGSVPQPGFGHGSSSKR